MCIVVCPQLNPQTPIEYLYKKISIGQLLTHQPKNNALNGARSLVEWLHILHNMVHGPRCIVIQDVVVRLEPLSPYDTLNFIPSTMPSYPGEHKQLYVLKTQKH